MNRAEFAIKYDIHENLDPATWFERVMGAIVAETNEHTKEVGQLRREVDELKRQQEFPMPKFGGSG